MHPFFNGSFDAARKPVWFAKLLTHSTTGKVKIH